MAGVPTLARGYLPWQGEVPTLAGGYLPWWGYLPWQGVPTLAGGTYLGEGVPTLARGAGGVPTLARGYLPWQGGVPTLAGGYLHWQGVPTLAGGQRGCLVLHRRSGNGRPRWTLSFPWLAFARLDISPVHHYTALVRVYNHIEMYEKNLN